MITKKLPSPPTMWLMMRTLALTSCTFADGTAIKGGALHAGGASSFLLLDAAFEDNVASEHGSAINYEPTSFETAPVIHAEAMRFNGNTGLSTVRAANSVSWICPSGTYAPAIGAFDGDWVGCPFSLTSDPLWRLSSLYGPPVWS